MRLNPLAPFQRRDLETRKKLLEPFSTLRSEFDHLWDEFLDLDMPLSRSKAFDFAPNVDASETDSNIVLKADLPGMKEDDIELEIDGDILSLRGERVEEREEEKEKTRLVERSHGRFERMMRLPFTPGEKDVNTSFSNGVLTVKVRKPKELPGSARKIPISKAD